jgi:hypothetical protein
MSFFMDQTDKKPEGVVEALIQKVLADAKTLWPTLGYTEGWVGTGFGIATLRPRHVGGGGSIYWGSSHVWASSFVASNTWEAWISMTQTDAAYVICTGMFNFEPAPKSMEIYLALDGKDLPTMNIEEMYALELPRAYWKWPWSISPQKPWIFNHKGINTGVEREGLLGYCVGTRAYLLTRT